MRLEIFGALFCAVILFGCTSDAMASDSSAKIGAVVSAQDFGVVGDGKTDGTAALQKLLDRMSRAGGGVVHLGRGNFLFRGHLNVPSAVALEGIWQSVPSHNGLRDAGFPKPTDDGTTLLVTEGRGSEKGPAFITLNTNSTLKGVVIYYPDQKVDQTPVAYPYAIAMRGKNPAVLEVELLNPYNGIDASNNERHLIRDVTGQPIRRGIFVDAIYDIGRIEDVHFNPWWSMKPAVMKFQMKYGQAFIFGRTDWQYVFNTFCFGYNTGYDFISTKTGDCNGNFLGIGADDCWTAVNVDDAEIFGVLITNGEFTAFEGPDPTMIRVAKSNKGAIRFVNCAFWGPHNRTAAIDGDGVVGFSDCTFAAWDKKTGARTDATIQANGGTVLIRGCEFMIDRPQVELGTNVRRAVVTDNVVEGTVRIKNDSHGQVAIKNNLGTDKGARPGQ